MICLCVDSVVVGSGRECRGVLKKQHEVACNNTILYLLQFTSKPAIKVG